MAGDWIKVEHATLDKPEILRMAEVLGISQDACLGLFFRYWVWLDKNLSDICPGVVRNVSRKGLDEHMHCPGFAALLELVGWATFDNERWELHVANHDRHNGKPAKSRALDANRKQTSRREMSGSEPDTNGTREEKRRVSTSLRSVDKAALPPWVPADAWREFCKFRSQQRNWTPKAEALCLQTLQKLNADGHDPQRVIEQSIANGWRGLFAIKPAGSPQATDKRAATAAAMYGGARATSAETDITGESVRVA